MTEATILALYGLLVVVTMLLQATGAMTQLGMDDLPSGDDDAHPNKQPAPDGAHK